MKLSHTVSYAIQATMKLAEAGMSRPVPCSKLAMEGNMPERFLLQILRNLVTHGILQSTRGVDGGYTLERNPRDISLLEIVEAVEGPLDSTLPEEVQVLSEKDGQLREALHRVAEAMRERMATIKLSDLTARPVSRN